MGCLNVRERNQVAECSAKSAIDMMSLYEAARNGGGKVFDDEESLNYFDLSDIKLTEAQLQQLMSGQLVPSGRWCEPTGITFAGFGPAGVDFAAAARGSGLLGAGPGTTTKARRCAQPPRGAAGWGSWGGLAGTGHGRGPSGGARPSPSGGQDPGAGSGSLQRGRRSAIGA